MSEPNNPQVLTAESLLHAVWANNHSGDAGDSTVDVRRERIEDQQRVDDKWARIDAGAIAGGRSESEIEDALLEELGLSE